MHELSPETKAIAEAFEAGGIQTFIGTDYDCRYLAVPIVTDEARGRTVSARFSYVHGAVRLAPSMDMLPPGRYIYVTVTHFYQWYDLLDGYPDVLQRVNRIAYEGMQRAAFINFHTSFTLEDVISLQLIVSLAEGETPTAAALDTLEGLGRIAKAVYHVLDEYESADQE